VRFFFDKNPKIDRSVNVKNSSVINGKEVLQSHNGDLIDNIIKKLGNLKDLN
jgi:hypothetical protein